MTDSALDENSFFVYLKENFEKELIGWSEPEWRVCVPTNDVLHSSVFNQQFVESHILQQPSDSGELQSIGCGNSRLYKIQENLLQCSNQERQPAFQHDINILSEHLLTIKSALIHVLLVGEIFDPTAQQEEAQLPLLDNFAITSIDQAEQFLRVFSCHWPVLTDLQQQLTVWQGDLPLHDMQNHLHDLLLDTWDALIKRHSNVFQSSTKFHDLLYNAIDFVVVGWCHIVVWWRVRDRCGSMDELVTLRLSHLRTACFTAQQLCLPLLADITAPAAVVELAALGTVESALGRLHCIHAALDHLQAHAKQARAELHTYNGAEGPPPSVTSEELQGLLTMTIIESQCQHLVSNLYYTSHYVFSLPDHHVLRRSATLVRNALQVIMQLDISEIIKTPSKPPLRKEMSLHDLIKISSAVEQRFDRPRSAGGSEPNISCLDLHWQQLTNRIQRSTMESATIEQGHAFAHYSPRSTTASSGPSSPYSPLGSVTRPSSASLVHHSPGLVNSFMEFLSTLPSTIRASLRRKQTKQRQEVAGAFHHSAPTGGNY